MYSVNVGSIKSFERSGKRSGILIDMDTGNPIQRYFFQLKQNESYKMHLIL